MTFWLFDTFILFLKMNTNFEFCFSQNSLSVFQCRFRYFFVVAFYLKTSTNFEALLTQALLTQKSLSVFAFFYIFYINLSLFIQPIETACIGIKDQLLYSWSLHFHCCCCFHLFDWLFCSIFIFISPFMLYQIRRGRRSHIMLHPQPPCPGAQPNSLSYINLESGSGPQFLFFL